MSFIDSASLVVHVSTGFLALIAGPVAMFSRKGGVLHRRSGATFVAAMGAVGS